MTDISLKDYLNNLDTLLRNGSYDEVIHHCRHILQYYPKNVAAYRALGQALAASGTFQEAADVFRRVLGVYPEDYIAHTQISEIYQRTNRPNEAIWHLERAFEQDPSSARIVDNLRELYRQHRSIDFARLQLTAGAVARQYMRSGLHAQAVETLHDALERFPKRLDLRLLLAQTLWESGRDIDAAETALEVLKTMPDCMEANAILTRLWLSQDRPSDAQRYLSRIEAVDPYAAMQIATNRSVPDNAFLLPEIDYRSATRSSISAQPDWLAEIGAAPGEAEDWVHQVDTMAEFERGEDFTPMPGAPDLAIPVPDDWRQDQTPAHREGMTDLFAGIQPDTGANTSSSGLTGLLNTLDKPEQKAEPEPAFDFGDDLANIDEEAAQNVELPDWLMEAAPVDAAQETPAAPEETPADAVDWIRSSGIELMEDESLPSMDLFGDADQQTAETFDTVDPLAWLRDSGVEVAEGEPEPNPAFMLEEDEMTYQDPDSVDPLGWLKGSGVEVAEEEPGSQPSVVNNMPSGNEADPMAWLKESGGTLMDEAAPDLSQSAASMLEANRVVNAQEESLDWLGDDTMLDEVLDLESLSGDQSFGAGTGPDDQMFPNKHTSTANNQTDIFPGSQPLDDDETARASFSAEPLSDWQDPMSDQNDNQLPDWLTEPSSEESEAASSGLEWLSGEAAASEEPMFQDDESALDWMAEVHQDSPMSADDANEEPEWLGEFDAIDMAEISSEQPEMMISEPGDRIELPQSETQSSFEWLAAENEPAKGFEIPAEPTAAPDWEIQSDQMAEFDKPESEQHSSFEWLAAENEPAEDFEPAEPVEVPDWLSQAAPASAADQPQPEAEDSSFEWLAAENEPAEDFEPAGPVEVPDWLSQAAPASAADQPQPEAEDSSFEWLAAENEPAEDFEPAGPVEVPDWLSQAAPASPADQPQPEAEDSSFEWLAAENEPAEDFEPAEPVEVPDWLSQAAPASAADQPQPEAEDSSFEWLAAENEPAEDFEPAEPVEVPDWLSQAAPASPADQPQPEDAEAEAVQADYQWAIDDQPGWLDELASAEDIESEAEQVGAGPDWLEYSDEDEGEFAASSEDNPNGDIQFDWARSTEEEPQPEPETAAAEASEFTWMGELSGEPDSAAPDVTTEPDAEPLYESVEMSDDEIGEEDEIERVLATAPAPPPAENAPDWLNAMVPGLDLDYQAEEDKPIESEYLQTSEEKQAHDFDWLVDIVDEETGRMAPLQVEPEQRSPRFNFSFTRRPAWLSRSNQQRQQPESAEPNRSDDFELPDWLK